jgi:hypothetical protein
MFWNRWFKDKNALQEVCLISETNFAKDEKMEADLLHASSPETAEGWLLESRQMVKDEITNEYIQFVSSKYGCPIRIYKVEEESNPNIEGISSQTEDQEMVFTTDQHSKSGMMLWVGIATGLLTLTVLVVVLVTVV